MLTQRQIFALAGVFVAFVVCIAAFLLLDGKDSEPKPDKVVLSAGSQHIPQKWFDEYLDNATKGKSQCNLEDSECQDKLNVLRGQIAQRFIGAMQNINVATSNGIALDSQKAKESMQFIQLAQSEKKLSKQLRSYLIKAAYAESQIQIKANRGVSKARATKAEKKLFREATKNELNREEAREFSVLVFQNAQSAQKAWQRLKPLKGEKLEQEETRIFTQMSAADKATTSQAALVFQLLNKKVVPANLKGVLFSSPNQTWTSPTRAKLPSSFVAPFFPSQQKKQATASLGKQNYYIFKTLATYKAIKASEQRVKKIADQNATFQKQQELYKKQLQKLRSKAKQKPKCSKELAIRQCL